MARIDAQSGVVALGMADNELEVVEGRQDFLRQRFGARLALLARDQLGYFLGALVDQTRQDPQVLATFLEPRPTPECKTTDCGIDRALHVLGSGVGHAGERFAGRWIDQRGLPTPATGWFAVDERE